MTDTGEPSGREAGGGETDEGGRGRQGGLIVEAETPVVVEPGLGAFDVPALGHGPKATVAGRGLVMAGPLPGSSRTASAGHWPGCPGRRPRRGAAGAGPGRCPRPGAALITLCVGRKAAPPAPIKPPRRFTAPAIRGTPAGCCASCDLLAYPPCGDEVDEGASPRAMQPVRINGRRAKTKPEPDSVMSRSAGRPVAGRSPAPSPGAVLGGGVRSTVVLCGGSTIRRASLPRAGAHTRAREGGAPVRRA